MFAAKYESLGPLDYRLRSAGDEAVAHLPPRVHGVRVQGGVFSRLAIPRFERGPVVSATGISSPLFGR